MTASELGKNGSHKYIWSLCDICGEGRWSRLEHGEPRRTKHQKCSLAIRPSTKKHHATAEEIERYTPVTGDIRRGYEIGRKDHSFWAWLPCKQCSCQRWVYLIKSIPSYDICNKCRTKDNAIKRTKLQRGQKVSHEPKVGDVRYASDIGIKCKTYYKYVQCSKCGKTQWHKLPNYDWDGDKSFVCLSCNKKGKNTKPAGVSRQCSKCRQVLPATRQYFQNSNSFAGIGMTCKKCRQVVANKYRVYKMATDIRYRLRSNMSSAVGQSLRKNKSGHQWEKLVGYTVDDLKRHLESQFDEDMNWNNYGKYWSIDHIVPVSAFSITNYDDVSLKVCWGLANLRPLLHTENMRKHNKIIKPFQSPLFIVGT